MIYAYDVESFANFFSAIFINVNNLTDRHVFITHDLYRDDNNKLIEFLQQDNLTLVGHNSLSYDDLMLRAIIMFPHIKGEQLQRLTSRLIVGSQDDRKDIPHYYELAYPDDPMWVSIDTLALTRVNQIRVSLKHAGVVLRHNKLQDLPLPPGSSVAPDMVDDIIKYNINDVLITIKLYKELLPMIDMRREVSESFGVDVLTANDTEIAKQILAKRYSEATGIPLNKLKSMRTERGVLRFGDCIGKNIEFETPELQGMVKSLENKLLYPSNFYKYRKDIVFDGVEYHIGVGGLHSADPPRILRSNDKYIIRDSDATSFYPNILMLNGFYPEHLGEEYLVLYKSIVDERVVAKAEYKRTGNKAANVKQAGLKIAINSGFGLMGNRYAWLYDPKALVSITISGQLYLLDLIEKLYLAGIHTVSANTDGIVCKIPREMENLFFDICHIWEERTRFTLEYTDYAQLIQRDVNNYLTIKPDGKTKTKGLFQNDAAIQINGEYYDTAAYNLFLNGTNDLSKYRTIPGFSKGFKSPVISVALYQYFVHGIAPMTTIKNHHDITDFLTSQRANAEKFETVVTELDENGDLINSEMQKTNRYLVTTLGNGVSLHKDHKYGGKDVSMLAGQHVQILNDIDSYNPKDYNINYKWYGDEVWKVINQIDPPYAKLW